MAVLVLKILTAGNNHRDSTGNIYSEAVDPVGSGRTYTETDTPIEQTEDDRVAQLEEDSKALKILLGKEEETK